MKTKKMMGGGNLYQDCGLYALHDFTCLSLVDLSVRVDDQTCVGWFVSLVAHNTSPHTEK